jgi:hypothetical protein
MNDTETVTAVSSGAPNVTGLSQSATILPQSALHAQTGFPTSQIFIVPAAVALSMLNQLLENMKQTGELVFNTSSNYIRNQTKIDMILPQPAVAPTGAPAITPAAAPTRAPAAAGTISPVDLSFPYDLNGKRIAYLSGAGNADVNGYIQDFAKLNIDIVSYIRDHHQTVNPSFIMMREDWDVAAFNRIKFMMMDIDKQYDFVNRVLQNKYSASSASGAAGVTDSALPFVFLFLGGILFVSVLKKK